MSTDKSTQLTVDRFDLAAEAYTQGNRLTQVQIEQLARFLAESRKRHLSTAQMAESLGVSTTTVSRVFRGIYEGDVAAIADKAALAVRLWTERSGKRGGFIETSIARKVFTACDFALTRQTPIILTGLSQMGKTTAIHEYARRSDATVRILRIPASTSLIGVLAELADTLGIPSSLNILDRRRRILNTLNDRTLLIVDELHELVVSATRTQARRVCEVLRELYDRTGCGLVLCGTDTLETDLLYGPDAGLLDQIVQRSVVMRLPRRLPSEDIAKVTASYGLTTPPSDEAHKILRTIRMNQLCLITGMAAETAQKRTIPLTWELWLQTKLALLGE